LGFPKIAVCDSLGGRFGVEGMTMSEPRDERQNDLFRPALDQIINLDHPLVRLAGTIDWEFLDQRFASVCRAGAGEPALVDRI
jgi:IS5 family transposase